MPIYPHFFAYSFNKQKRSEHVATRLEAVILQWIYKPHAYFTLIVFELVGKVRRQIDAWSFHRWSNLFEVYAETFEGAEFFWVVYAKRNDIEVEPPKKKVKVNGEGPYRWIN